MQKNRLLLGLAGFGLIRWGYRKWRESEYSYRGKIVLLSGGSRGLGLVLARQLAGEGAKIAVLGRNLNTLREAQKEFKDGTYFPIECDVTKAKDVKRAVEATKSHFGAIDVLIHNAGIIQMGPYENLSTKDYKASLNTHFWGAFHLIQNCKDELKRSAAPRILLIDSIGGKFGIPHLSSYCTGKFALSGFAQSIRPELSEMGIPLTIAYPSLMRTGSADHGHFRGDVKEERFWFTLLDSLPVLTLPASKAARLILNASRAARLEVIPGVVGHLGVLVSQLSPSLFEQAMRLGQHSLPKAQRDFKARDQKQGLEIGPDPRLTGPAFLTHLAAMENNEV